jgi:uncharacterized protein
MVDFEQLEARVGRAHLSQRLDLQAHHYSRHVTGVGRTFLHIERMRRLHRIIRAALKLTGLYGIGHRNSLALKVRENRFVFPDLPPAFDGFTLLHLSDLHLDNNPELTDVLIERLAPLEYDLCVITGDFRESTFDCYDRAVQETLRLRQAIKTDTFAVFGNHDFIEMTDELEAGGIRLLLNEAVALRRDDDTLWLGGVDDPHFYEVDNLERVVEAIPAEAFAILLAHSPDLYRKAAYSGFQLYLCGHTHGGQLCLPGRIPIASNTRCPFRYARGAWKYHALTGYTSWGTGTSAVNVRYNCPPEICLHRLVLGFTKLPTSPSTATPGI